MTARTALAPPLLLASLVVGFAQPLAAQDTLGDRDPLGEGATAAGSESPSPAAATPSASGDGTSDLPPGALATVNERPVPALALESIVRQLETGGGEVPDRERILDELIDLEILTQEAEKMELDRRPEIAAALQLQYTQTMANAFLAALGDEIEFSEEELRAEYDRQTANIDREEYQASHVLLESEADAQEVIDELAGGADFAALARERSIDPAGQDGGDLGWFVASSMDPRFAAAVERMEVGTSSTEPVESDFGWHVILLSDKRGTALPDYESVKPGLTNLALRNRLAARLEELRGSADIVRR